MFAIIGKWFVLIVGVIISIKLAYWLIRAFKRKPFKWFTDGEQWALVTGATNGIGFEFARQLSHRGCNLLLISRNDQKLQLARQKILDDLPRNQLVQVRTHAADFTRTDIYDQIEEFLDVNANDIFVVVNNVGMNSTVPDFFMTNGQESRRLNRDMINVNVLAATEITALVLPSMQRRRRGLLINVSSIVSQHVSPMLAVYSATKAYMSQLSQALAVECESTGISVATFRPFIVSTAMSHNMATNIVVPSAEQYVRTCLGRISHTGGLFSTGYWTHTVVDHCLNAVSFLVSRHFLARCIFQMMNISKEKLHRFEGMHDRPQQVSFSMLFDKG